MKGIELPAALALLLGADLAGSAKRKGECLLEGWLALDLATDVADDPAQPAAQDTQLPLMPPELFGMGVAARHHRSGLGHARIGLPGLAAGPFPQEFGALVGPLSQLGSGGEGVGFGRNGGAAGAGLGARVR